MKLTEKVSYKISDRLLAAGIIQEQEKDIYIYGLQQGLYILFNILTTVALGLFFNMLLYALLFTVAFIPLRQNAGGYHAKTPFRCYLLGSMVTALSLLAVKVLYVYPVLSAITVLIGGAVIFILAPTQDNNNPLDDTEKKVYGKRARIIYAFELCAFTVLIIFKLYEAAATLAAVMLVLAFSLPVGRIKLYLQAKNK